MVTLRNPETGTVRDFPERKAEVKRREGWVDVSDPTPWESEPDPFAYDDEDDE